MKKKAIMTSHYTMYCSTFEFYCLITIVILLCISRHDYVDRMDARDLPNLKKFVQEGARPKYVQPIFPSVSFPCWTSVMTGAFPDVT